MQSCLETYLDLMVDKQYNTAELRKQYDKDKLNIRKLIE